jgi:hypothetical protein
MTKPKLYVEDPPIVQPPSNMTVMYEAKPVLYLPNGKVLVRRPGF